MSPLLLLKYQSKKQEKYFWTKKGKKPVPNGNSVVQLVDWQHPRDTLALLQQYCITVFRNWSGRSDSNRQQSAWKAETLPIELHPLINQ